MCTNYNLPINLNIKINCICCLIGFTILNSEIKLYSIHYVPSLYIHQLISQSHHKTI